MGGKRERLDQLTDRWRARHDARRPDPANRPPADPERERRARAAFPYRTESPAAYAERHGRDMIGFTYDEHAYDDPELDAWLLELGRILAERRRERRGG
ncbi:MAG TPA: hypothetical protein VFH63_10655 [candidate division Zixibacteria bacterium]|nr:hypothetical protein [candidate division Zixibacteria bacterium]